MKSKFRGRKRVNFNNGLLVDSFNYSHTPTIGRIDSRYDFLESHTGSGSTSIFFNINDFKVGQGWGRYVLIGTSTDSVNGFRDGWNIGIEKGSGDVIIWSGNYNSPAGNRYIGGVFTAGIQTNTDYHLVVVKSGATFRVYLNGKALNGYSEFIGIPSITTKPITLGSRNIEGLTNRGIVTVSRISFFNSEIDKINNVTDLSYIRFIHKNGIVPPVLHKNCIGDWSLQEKSGNIYFDNVEEYNYAKTYINPAIPNQTLTDQNVWYANSLYNSFVVSGGTLSLGTFNSTLGEYYTYTTINSGNINGCTIKINFEITEAFNGTNGVKFTFHNRSNASPIGGLTYKNIGVYTIESVIANDVSTSDLFKIWADYNTTTGKIKNLSVVIGNQVTGNHIYLQNYDLPEISRKDIVTKETINSLGIHTYYDNNASTNYDTGTIGISANTAFNTTTDTYLEFEGEMVISATNPVLTSDMNVIIGAAEGDDWNPQNLWRFGYVSSNGYRRFRFGSRLPNGSRILVESESPMHEIQFAQRVRKVGFKRVAWNIIEFYVDGVLIPNLSTTITGDYTSGVTQMVNKPLRLSGSYTGAGANTNNDRRVGNINWFSAKLTVGSNLVLDTVFEFKTENTFKDRSVYNNTLTANGYTTRPLRNSKYSLEKSTALPEPKNAIRLGFRDAGKQLNVPTGAVSGIGSGNWMMHYQLYFKKDMVWDGTDWISEFYYNGTSQSFVFYKAMIIFGLASGRNVILNAINKNNATSGEYRAWKAGFYTFTIQKVGVRHLLVWVNGVLQLFEVTDDLTGAGVAVGNRPYSNTYADFSWSGVTGFPIYNRQNTDDVYLINFGIRKGNYTTEQILELHSTGQFANPKDVSTWECFINTEGYDTTYSRFTDLSGKGNHVTHSGMSNELTSTNYDYAISPVWHNRINQALSDDIGNTLVDDDGNFLCEDFL